MPLVPESVPTTPVPTLTPAVPAGSVPVPSVLTPQSIPAIPIPS
jgi:hypothetical protein